MEQNFLVTVFTAFWMFSSVFAACKAADGKKIDAVWAVFFLVAAAVLIPFGVQRGCLNWWCSLYLLSPPIAFYLIKCWRGRKVKNSVSHNKNY